MTPSLLPVALEAVDLAHQLITTHPAGVVTAKSDRDPVTELDLTIERAVREFLAARTPDIGFLGEEEGSADDRATRRWVLDPIDGTANLTHGIPLCAISLALVEDGRSVLGVIDLPFLGARYTAEEGNGAFRNGKPIHASATSRLQDAVVSIGDYALGESAAERNRPRFAITQLLAARAQRVRMLGSAAIDLVWVADGKLDASIMLANKPWDTAAGTLIAHQAGALVLDQTGEPHTPASTATIAVAPTLAGELLSVIRDLRPTPP